MYIAADVRNNLVTLGLWENETWSRIVHFSPDRTADEYALLFKSLQPAPGDIAGACIASVVPALTPRIAQAILDAFGIEPLQVGPGLKTGLKIRTDNPSELGADFVCTALAARQRLASRGARAACVVVDCGAALTLSAINGDGEFLGVAIAPGLETSSKALRIATAQLPEVRLLEPKAAIGKNTAQAMQSGLMFGFAGLVSELLKRMQEELGEIPVVVGCGEAYGKPLLAKLGYGDFVPELALEGIVLILKNNETFISGRTC